MVFVLLILPVQGLTFHRHAIQHDDESYLDGSFRHINFGGTSGVLIFKKLYQNLVPDNPGGDSRWTNPAVYRQY
jgi:hypothetical protein